MNEARTNMPVVIARRKRRMAPSLFSGFMLMLLKFGE